MIQESVVAAAAVVPPPVSPYRLMPSPTQGTPEFARTGSQSRDALSLTPKLRLCDGRRTTTDVEPRPNRKRGTSAPAASASRTTSRVRDVISEFEKAPGNVADRASRGRSPRSCTSQQRSSRDIPRSSLGEHGTLSSSARVSDATGGATMTSTIRNHQTGAESLGDLRHNRAPCVASTADPVLHLGHSAGVHPTGSAQRFETPPPRQHPDEAPAGVHIGHSAGVNAADIDLDSTMEYSQGGTPLRQLEVQSNTSSARRAKLAKELELAGIREERVARQEERLTLEIALANLHEQSSDRSRTSCGNAASLMAPLVPANASRRASNNVRSQGSRRLAERASSIQRRSPSQGPSRMDVTDDADVQGNVVHNTMYHMTHVGQIGVAPEVAAQSAMQIGVAMHNVASQAAAAATVEARNDTEQRFTSVQPAMTAEALVAHNTAIGNMGGRS